MRNVIHLTLHDVFRVTWWCGECWQRGELLYTRGVDASTIQAEADRRHDFNYANCAKLQVHVEFSTARLKRVTEGQLLAHPDYLSPFQLWEPPAERKRRRKGVYSR